jgi:SAM-dependent methyltransferase
VNEDGRQQTVVNVGCGPLQTRALPAHFDGWRHLRVDVDPSVRPDIVADLTDLSPIPDGMADAVWASHCVEHLYLHQVSVALKEFHRVTRKDGFVCMLVPDLQAIAGQVAADRLHEPLYRSPAGPVSAHDMLYGFGAAIAGGNVAMAHRCGFTPSMLRLQFEGIGFAELALRRHADARELMAVARCSPARDDAERSALLNALRS